jgi:hypothetical protein
MLDSAGIRWFGVVFRARRTTASPFGVGGNLTTGQGDLLRPENRHRFPSDDEPPISQPWGSRPLPDFGDEPTETAPIQGFPSFGGGLGGVPEETRVPENLFSATENSSNISPRMKTCKHRACGVEIFESMLVCPFCSTKQ